MKILFAWELGGGAGHLETLAPVARALRTRGHDVCMVVKDIPLAETLVGADGFPILQAPAWTKQAVNLPQEVSYAELLYHTAFVEPDGLRAMVKAWLRLYDYLAPDLVLGEHAPTALLAARFAGVRCAASGTGFTCPPNVCPMPSIQPWHSVPARRLQDAEERICLAINAVAKAMGRPALANVGELFAVDETFLCTFAELDAYGARPGATYWGPQAAAAGHAQPQWPEADGARIFAYLPVDHRELPTLYRQLRASRLPTLMVVSGAPSEVIAPMQAPTLRVTNVSVSMPAVLDACRLVVCHGGHGMVVSGLLAGRPLLVAPMYLEQSLNGYRMANRGAGLMAAPGQAESDYGAMIRRILEAPGFAAKAEEFASRYRGFDRRAQSEAIARRCEELAGTS